MNIFWYHDYCVISPNFDQSEIPQKTFLVSCP